MKRSDEVTNWFKKFDHPLKKEMELIRELILAADPKIGECIKWSCPTFVFEGNLASFNPRAKKHVSLMFHTGATIPGKFKHLEGTGPVGRFMSFQDITEIKSKANELKAIVRAWCNDRTDRGTSTSDGLKQKKSTTTKKTTRGR